MKEFLIIFSAICFPFLLNAQQTALDPDHGMLQSPININTNSSTGGMHHIELHYQTSHEHILHEEHTVELIYDPGSYLIFDDKQYNFKQFHFHTPSEHYIDGVHYPLEMHLVHSDDRPSPHYLVIAILFKEGPEDVFLSHFLNEVPEDFRELDISTKYIDIKEEIWDGELNQYYFYRGSLTTKPYTETVSWLILQHIHQASPHQIARLKKLEGENNRSLQKLNRRTVENVKGNGSFIP
jgi:carbonic anhydrase